MTRIGLAGLDLPRVIGLIALGLCSALCSLAAQAPRRTTASSFALARAITPVSSLTPPDDWAAVRDARVSSWVRTSDRPKTRNYWKAGAVIGCLAGAVAGGAIAMDRIHQRHAGAGGPEYVLVNGLFPGFIIGGAIGGIAGALIHTSE